MKTLTQKGCEIYVELLNEASAGKILGSIPVEFINDEILMKISKTSIRKQEGPLELRNSKVSEHKFADVVVGQCKKMSFNDLLKSIDSSKVGDYFLEQAVKNPKVVQQLKEEEGIDLKGTAVTERGGRKHFSPCG